MRRRTCVSRVGVLATSVIALVASCGPVGSGEEGKDEPCPPVGCDAALRVDFDHTGAWVGGVYEIEGDADGQVQRCRVWVPASIDVAPYCYYTTRGQNLRQEPLGGMGKPEDRPALGNRKACPCEVYTDSDCGVTTSGCPGSGECLITGWRCLNTRPAKVSLSVFREGHMIAQGVLTPTYVKTDCPDCLTAHEKLKVP